MNNLQSLAYYIPELIVVATVLVAIVVDLFTPKEVSRRVGYWMIAGLALTMIALYSVQTERTTSLFMDMLAFDAYSHYFKYIILLATILIILVSQQSKELDGYSTGEFYTLLGIMVFGMFLMVSSIDLIMVYLSLEIVSISSFILSGYLKNDLRSTESSLKYVIYGAFSSGMMLFGLSLLFGLSGSTNFFDVREAIGALNGSGNLALVISFVLILAGFGYKISAVPFHFWTPDVYEGAPTSITAYLSVAPKAAGFALIIRFFHDIFTDGGVLSASLWLSTTDLPWPQLIAVLSVMTMTLGNLVALQQENLKRMLAYSSIAHAGYMMMALPLLSGDGIHAILIYLIMYLFMNLGAFFVVISVKNKTGQETFDEYKGLGWQMPLVGVTMAIFMFALTGLPPTVGFIGKFYLFAAVINAGPAFYWLAFAGMINSVISLYYYIRVIKVMYLEGERSEQLVYPSVRLSTLLILLAVPSIVFGIYWSPIADWVRNSLIFFTAGM